jgi:hypothetical protein
MERMIQLPHKALLTLFVFWWLVPAALGQQEPKPSQTPAVPAPSLSPQGTPPLSLEQQMALSLLRQVAGELKGEADKPAATLIQAQIADTLWKFEESEARSLFRLAFDTAKQTIPETSVVDKEARDRHLDAVRRQASTIKEITRLFGTHDRSAAEQWLESLNKEQTTKEGSTNKISRERAEFLIQLAIQQAKTNPAEAQKLGFLAIAGDEIPSAVGQLLFSLKAVDPIRSDVLFRAAIASLRRIGSFGGATLSILSNYLFFSDGRLFSSTSTPEAQMFIDFLIEAANNQVAILQAARANKAPPPESGTHLTNFLSIRGLAIVARNGPDRLPILQSLFNELYSALNQQQLDDLRLLSNGLRQQDAMEARSEGGLDAQIQQAEHEKDPVVRDYLWRSLAIGMMRGDPDRAFSIAARIDDKPMREQTQDDINLVVAGETVRNASYEETRKVALKFNDTNLRSKTLAELADRVLRFTKNRERASELLTEAYEVAAKGEPTADRAAITLLLAQKFARFDLERSFGLLEAAIKTINQTQITSAPSTVFSPGPRIRIFSITMVGGAELATGVHATLDSLNFRGLGELVRTDYFRARNMGDNLQNRIVRARYLITLAQSFLDPNRPIDNSSLPPFIR